MKSQAENILTRLHWDEKCDPNDYQIYYLDRQKGLVLLPYGAIISVKHGWICASLEYGMVMIPMHRVRKIICKGEVIFKRGE